MPETIPETLLLVLRELEENELRQFKRELEKLLFFREADSDPPRMSQDPEDPEEVLELLLLYHRERFQVLEVTFQLLRAIHRPDLAPRLYTPSDTRSGIASLRDEDEDEDDRQITEQSITLILPKPPRRDLCAIAESYNLEVEEKKNPEEFEILFSCPRCPREDHAINIRPETILDPERGYNIYRLKCTKRGSFHCCITDFIFDVRAPVTLTYHFDSWTKHLNAEQRKHWLIVGPLLDIQADPEEAIKAIHIPHFLCLQGNVHSKIRIAHFMKDGMSLERPDRVESFHVKLKNPTFSSRGAVLKKQWFKRKIKAHAVALLYQDLRVPILKFHLYLLPNDSSLKKAVHEHELNYDSQRVRKPPATMKALTIGSHFFLEKIVGVAIHPEKLEFKYLSADMEHQYLELFADHMEDALRLSLVEKKKNELVWTAYIRREDLHPVKDQKQNAGQSTDGPVEKNEFCTTAAVSRQTHTPLTADAIQRNEKHQPGSPGMHFIEQHREKLIDRTNNVEGVLDALYGTVIDYAQYQKILSRDTPQNKMRELYMLVPSWNRFCKDQLYEALKDKQKFLIEDLEGR
ncbi:NACHT, LRR and PYD domains-containing protein 1-like isoform X2 [Sceloporus undulatus]|uniref:NACHT, LRR and PYD domains-containing protein 1-like isoform X2 n=1 Tax=Sceloporus undulatus TaxID=8520 RepID=UPI001C4B08CE|nr:NACHT, LRR and PYD domains-containing protein 1-like isoform X2 [Sceloporus undulatus]